MPSGSVDRSVVPHKGRWSPPKAKRDIQETYSRSLMMRRKLSPYTCLSSPHHPASLSLSLFLFLLAEDAGNTGERDSEKALRSRFQTATDPRRAGGREGTRTGGSRPGFCAWEQVPSGSSEPHLLSTPGHVAGQSPGPASRPHYRAGSVGSGCLRL